MRGQYEAVAVQYSIFLITMAIISSLRRNLTVQGKVAQWVRPLPITTLLMFEPHRFFPLPSSFSGMFHW